jgi:hypothetical protein
MSIAPQATGIIGTFYVNFQDADARSPLQKEDEIVISETELVIRRGGSSQTFTIEESYARWGCARGPKDSAEMFYIEFNRSSNPLNPQALYGHVVQEKSEVINQDPPVGVWGADTQPPRDPDGGETR